RLALGVGRLRLLLVDIGQQVRALALQQQPRLLRLAPQRLGQRPSLDHHRQDQRRQDLRLRDQPQRDRIRLRPFQLRRLHHGQLRRLLPGRHAAASRLDVARQVRGPLVPRARRPPPTAHWWALDEGKKVLIHFRRLFYRVLEGSNQGSVIFGLFSRDFRPLYLSRTVEPQEPYYLSCV